MKTLQMCTPTDPVLLEVPVPEPGAGEVLMRIDAVTTCPQWDLHLRHNEPMFAGHRFIFPYAPGQPGHEATGRITALVRVWTACRWGSCKRLARPGP